MKPGILVITVVTAVAALVALTATVLFVTTGIAGAAEGDVTVSMVDPSVLNWGFASAAVSAALSAMAAGYAVAQVGSAAVGALAEKPELMGRVLVVVGLAEGIAIYGLIVAILILNRLG